ncbi:MAG: SDR family oxidoreductase [Cyanobacterium sp. T60_A2020_053]|nr:SDR family oxidoreductase [Cyanobacterium sp. T60_A2020_053]
MVSTVLITGSSQGIGRSTAKLFASKGYNIVLAARTFERLSSVAQEIESLGVKALPIACDVTDSEQVNILMDKALTKFGHIDLLINNAGICMTAPMEKTTLEDWQRILNVNLWGYIYPIYALLPHFLERKQGTIVNVGSFGGKMPLPNMTAYCTSKYAVTGLTETLRLELEPKGIQVCGVHPSVTNSDFLSRAVFRSGNEQQEDVMRQQMKEMLKSPLASQPEDVAKAIWEVVQHPSPSVIVGSGALMTSIYSWFPGLTQWLMSRGTKG